MPEDNESELCVLRERIAKLEATTIATKESITIAKMDLDLRLNSMNEFREAIKDQNSTFIPREEYKTAHYALLASVQKNAEEIANMQGRAWMIAFFAGGIPVVIMLIL